MKVVVITKKGRYVLRFRVLTAIPEFIERTREIVGEDRLKGIYLVSPVKAYPPPGGKQAPRGMLWCPYCKAYRTFKPWINESLRCEVCHISTADYYVRAYNNLWNTLFSRRRRKGRTRVDSRRRNG